ncbi:MAG: BlaI/MecI/CopY family transcriptional regulator [Phycisphaeraceae bacterium]|nr:BlaI/MecI/CopY family transcriptional regulator [Phycisphaeraceae bacterium]
MPRNAPLAKREQQIMEVVYRRKEASATEVWQQIPDPPSRTAVRTLLRILEEKGHLKHKIDGREFIYAPIRPRKKAGTVALNNVIDTFFAGSLEDAVVAHLSNPRTQISPQQLRQLQNAIAQARNQGR